MVSCLAQMSRLGNHNLFLGRKSSSCGYCIISLSLSHNMVYKRKSDDVTSHKNAKLASDILAKRIKPTPKQVRTIAAIALDNAANKSKKRR